MSKYLEQNLQSNKKYNQPSLWQHTTCCKMRKLCKGWYRYEVDFERGGGGGG